MDPAAATGGKPLQAGLTGVVSGAAGGGIAGVMGPGLKGTLASGSAGGAVSGAIDAALNGRSIICGAVQGAVVGAGLSAAGRYVVGLRHSAGTLTAAEQAEIQAIANKHRTTIDVVGSRAAGEGRNIGSSLPVGKGKGTRSDIDFRIDTSHPQVEDLIADLQKVGNGAGRASIKHGTDHRPTYPPVIRIPVNE